MGNDVRALGCCWDVAQRAMIRSAHWFCSFASDAGPGKQENENSHAEKIHAGLFNNHHTRMLAHSGEVGYRAGFVT